jgi:hypothetical protein
MIKKLNKQDNKIQYIQNNGTQLMVTMSVP